MNRKNALVCSYHVVQPDRDSGSRRVFQLLDFLRQWDWNVTFLASDGVGNAADAKQLQQMGIPVYDGTKYDFKDLVLRGRFDLAILAFWPNAERYLLTLRKLSPETRIIVDSIDLHFVREARRVFSNSQSAQTLLETTFGMRMVQEVNAYAAADAVLTVSEKESNLINEFVNNVSHVCAVPDCEDIEQSPIPFEERRGIVCIGSFQHPPNVKAVAFLCKEVVPRLDPELLAQHPIYIVGNALNDSVAALGRGLPGVRMVGWVPSVLPYLERSRISVIPLLYGAGTKRKLIQALGCGTPTVSTSVGVEGFDLHHRQHVLVADDPADFADSVTTLLQRKQLWNRLMTKGRDYVVKAHSTDVSRECLSRVIETVFERRPKPVMDPPEQVAPQIRNETIRHIPHDARVLVVSKGDPELVQLTGLRASHFPQTDDGIYAGFHPKDSADAIHHLETLRGKGAEYLLFPKTAFWWFDHYVELKSHLDIQHALIHQSELLAIYRLFGGTTSPTPSIAETRVSLDFSRTPESRSDIGAQRTYWSQTDSPAVRLIAFYLPQFHPIPENDRWWGEGFTEWRNVAKARPQYSGHYQPHVPADLGFYDLRLPETREDQAALAQQYGVHGFCYYHYWFHGKQLLNRPFNEVLVSGRPDFPFCLCWANDPWSRRWDGREDDLLMAQTYSEEDDRRHVAALIPALSDPRAITVNGKPLFLVYRGKHLPHPGRTTDIWRKCVLEAGLKGIYLVAVETAWDVGWDATKVGFDAKVLFQPQFGRLMTHGTKTGARIQVPGRETLQVYDYKTVVDSLTDFEPVAYRRYDTVFANWDNTPRVADKAVIMHDSSPSIYEEWLRRVIAKTLSYPANENLVFINAWNEWAEGCHLEPDLRYGRAYLEATARALATTQMVYSTAQK